MMPDPIGAAMTPLPAALKFRGQPRELQPGSYLMAILDAFVPNRRRVISSYVSVHLIIHLHKLLGP